MKIPILPILALTFTFAFTNPSQALLENSREQDSARRAFQFAYYPATSELLVTADFARRNVRFKQIEELGKKLSAFSVEVRSADGKVVLAPQEVKLTDGKSDARQFSLPKLEGTYKVLFTLADGEESVTLDFPLERKVYEWEGNRLGVTDRVFAPFEPVKVEGNAVAVVGRTYQLDDIGLWSSVVSDGKELLARGMTLNFIRQGSSSVHSEWKAQERKLLESTAQQAVFESVAVNAGVRVKSRSTIEFDGMMRVDMDIEVVDEPVLVEKLWLDIPLKKHEGMLFHQYKSGTRVNEAGYLPAANEKGIAWDSRQARSHSTAWLNSFCAYIWMGTPQRGLAWFAETDKNWSTAKDGGETAIQEILREGDEVILRVHFFNQPKELGTTGTITFGMQASPTKPLPKDWRKQSFAKHPHSGPVAAWGGLCCAHKGPVNDDWEIVDKMMESRSTGKVPVEWLKEYREKHNVPAPWGTADWVKMNTVFSERYRNREGTPILVYHEEMAASTDLPEWQTFQDEWGVYDFTQRHWPDSSIFAKGVKVYTSAGVTFPKSYQDYGLHYANEWLKRGIGLYWDNTHPRLQVKHHGPGSGYRTEDGRIQPALTLWNQREYQKRTWNLLQEWKEKHGDEVPLEWSIHITNSLILPLHSFATTILDLEWSRFDSAFPPDMLLTETLGSHTGNYSFALNPLYGKNNLRVKDLDEGTLAKINWGMNRVHEFIPFPAYRYLQPDSLPPYEHRFRDFGYGEPHVAVMRYWDETPALKCSDPGVKWLLLADQKEGRGLLLLVNYGLESSDATLRLDPKVIGSGFSKATTDKETWTIGPDNQFTVPLGDHYDVKMIELLK